MPKVKNVEKKIWDIEGFDVQFLKTDGADVHGAKSGIPQYAFQNAADRHMTVNDWKKTRFLKQYPGFNVSVLDGTGKAVSGGQTKLSTVRDTYSDDEE